MRDNIRKVKYSIGDGDEVALYGVSYWEFSPRYSLDIGIKQKSKIKLAVVSPLHISTYPNIKLTHFHKISTKTPIYVKPPQKISPSGMKEDFGPCYST